MAVSIVMPCYNEAEIIEEVVRSYYRTIIEKITDSELIVVDDGSRDRTPEILGRLGRELPALRIIGRPINGGYGEAVQSGYAAAAKEWIFLVDSDGQFDPGDFWSLYELRSRYDFILGVRRPRKDALARRILSRLLRAVIRMLFGLAVKDVNCPFRLMRKDLVDRCRHKIPATSLIPNILIALLAAKYFSFAQIPVAHHRRRTGRVSIRRWRLIQFAARGLRQLLEFKMPDGRDRFQRLSGAV